MSKLEFPQNWEEEHTWKPAVEKMNRKSTLGGQGRLKKKNKDKNAKKKWTYIPASKRLQRERESIATEKR